MVTEFQFIVIDKSRLPIVVIKVKETLPTVKEYSVFLDALSDLLDLHAECYWVFDAQHANLTSGETRFLAAHWLKRERNRLKSKVRGVFFIQSPFWTSMELKAIFAVTKFPVPIQFLPALEDVEKMAAKRLRLVPA